MYHQINVPRAQIHSLYLFGADHSVHVRGLKNWNLWGGRLVACGGFLVTISSCGWRAVNVCLLYFKPRGAKHRQLWGLQVVWTMWYKRDRITYYLQGGWWHLCKCISGIVLYVFLWLLFKELYHNTHVLFMFLVHLICIPHTHSDKMGKRLLWQWKDQDSGIKYLVLFIVLLTNFSMSCNKVVVLVPKHRYWAGTSIKIKPMIPRPSCWAVWKCRRKTKLK